LGFGFYFSKNPVFGWVLGFFKLKKFLEIFRQNCDERRKKSKKIIQFLGCNGGKDLGSITNQPKSLIVNPYSTKSFGY
jgi:hypothetical protein